MVFSPMVHRTKVLYIITKSNWGGAQRYVYDLATRLPRDEFEVAVACGSHGPLVDKLREAGLAVMTVPALGRDIHPGKELAAWAALVVIVVRERPDIVHLSSTKVGGLGAMATFVAKLLPLRPFDKLRAGVNPSTVFTVHGWAFHEDRPAWQRNAIAFLSRLSAAFQHRIVLITNADYHAAERITAPEKLVLIRHGLGPIAFKARAEARAALAALIGHPVPPEIPLIGTIAELTKNKGLTYLIDAVNQVKFKVQSLPRAESRGLKFKVVIMGEGEERDRLQKKIRALGLKEDVHLIGFVPEAARYLKGLDCFVLPSVKEGLPYALMEAMAAGVPITATQVGGIPDLIEEGRHGLLVPAKNPRALAAAVTRMLASPEHAQAMAGRARERIETEFRIEDMVKKTSALYETLISH